MTDFQDQDLSGSHFKHVRLRDADFDQVDLSGARFRTVELDDAELRGTGLHRVRMRGLELVDVAISGEVQSLVVNGVEVAPLVEAELDRRMPERAKMRPEDSEGFREAWAILERLWEGTIARARAFPESDLHRSVDDEWSFIQTLRHLDFAACCWVDRMILGDPKPWHPLSLPWDEAPGWDGVPWDRDARPSLEEVLAMRHERRARIRGVLDSLTDEQLASTVTQSEPGPPSVEDFPVRECLLILLNEEWEHRLYAERDLSIIEKEG